MYIYIYAYIHIYIHIYTYKAGTQTELSAPTALPSAAERGPGSPMVTMMLILLASYLDCRVILSG